MNRRKSIGKLTILAGGIVLLSSGLLNACQFSTKKRTELTENDIPLLDEIGETIIPETISSPGAKATMIGAFMVSMVNDCFNAMQKNIFIQGLNTFDEYCQQKYKNAFIKLDSFQKNEFLIQLDTELKQNIKLGKTPTGEHYLNMLKQLTIKGYFTSEIGAKKALRYDVVPGKYEGCIEYKKGDKPWATA